MFVSGGMFVLVQLLLCRCVCVLWGVLNLSGGRFGGVKIRVFLLFVCFCVCVRSVCFLLLFLLFFVCFFKFCFVIGFVSVYFALFDSMLPLFLFNLISPLSTCRKKKREEKTRNTIK